MTTVVVLGEAMVELREEGPCIRHGVGGDTFNLALYLARTGVAEVRFVSALGDDPLSDEILRVARAEGIDVSSVVRVAGARPGLYLIRTDSNGERSFEYWRGEAPARRMLDGPDDVAAITAAVLAADWFAYSGITLAILPVEGRARLEEIVAGARAAGTRVLFDPNVRPSLWASATEARDACERAIGSADLVLASVDDGDHLFGIPTADEVAVRIGELGCSEVVVTAGGGPAAVRAAGWAGTVSPPPAEAVDTTAAGDAFDAGYLAARLAGAGADEAVTRGHQVAGRVVSGPGAIVPTGSGRGAGS